MDAFFVLADTAARSAAHGDLAFSALPHAPVRPMVERRHVSRSWALGLPRSMRRARSAMHGLTGVRRTAQVADCNVG